MLPAQMCCRRSRDMSRNILLCCGIFSSLLYAVMLVVVPLQWDGYNSASQTISELSAVGAPTRVQWTVPGAVYTVLIVAFGWGVWKSGAGNRALQISGQLIVIFGALGVLWPFAPMHSREVLAAGGATLSDTMHIVLGVFSVVLMLLAMTFGAASSGIGFRVYTLQSLVVLVIFGVLTFADAPGIAANLPTPWIGVWERINIAAFMLWVVVLAVTLLGRTEMPALKGRRHSRAA